MEIGIMELAVGEKGWVRKSNFDICKGRGGLNCDEILIALGGLHKKHVMQNGTWEPIKHFL